MRTIELLEKFELGGQTAFTKDKEVREIYSGARRRSSGSHIVYIVSNSIKVLLLFALGFSLAKKKLSFN